MYEDGPGSGCRAAEAQRHRIRWRNAQPQGGGGATLALLTAQYDGFPLELAPGEMRYDTGMIDREPSVATLRSPNDWLAKAGASIEGGRARLPMRCILVPMDAASRAIEEFERATDLCSRMRAIQLVAVNVRAADEAYFSEYAGRVNDAIGPDRDDGVCAQCLRMAASPDLVTLLSSVSHRIIHGMERRRETIVHPDAFRLAVAYYEEFMKLPLMGFNLDVTIESCRHCHCRKARVARRRDREWTS